jgi:hypothetical protein
MAQYDFVTQMKGPVVNESLFVDAMSKGTQAGNTVPGTIQSIVSGAQQGVEFVQDVRAKEAQIGLAEAQTDAYAARAQQLASAEASILKQEQDRIKAKELEVKELDLERRSTLLQQRGTLDNLLKTNDAQGIINSFKTNSLSQLYNSDEAARKAATNLALNDPRVPAQDKEWLFNMDRVKSRLVEQEKNYAQYTKDYEDKLTSLSNTEDIKIATASLGKAKAEEIIDDVVFVPSSQYALSPEGGYAELDVTGNIKRIPGDPKGPKTYSIIDKKTGRILREDATNDSYVAYSDFINARDLIQGKYTKNKIEEEVITPNKSNKTPNIVLNSKDTPPVDYVAKLGVKPTVVEKAKPLIEQFETSIKAIYTPEAKVSAQKQAQLVARALSDAEFDESEALQTRFNIQAVAEHNGRLMATGNKDLEYMFAIDGKDLYYKTVGSMKYVSLLEKDIPEVKSKGQAMGNRLLEKLGAK